MRILENEILSNHTTIRIGGVAKKYLIPESVEELEDIIENKHPTNYIGGGSNLLISEKEHELVVDLSVFNKEIIYKENGFFQVGASVRLQDFINFVNEMGYGGIEFLYSVPGLVGGAIVMNAGRGKVYHQVIADYVYSVEILKENSIITLKKEECGFEHRSSKFKNNNMIILSCLFKFPKKEKSEAEKEKKDRILLCKETQDLSSPNFGSVFLKCDSGIMKFAKRIRLGGKHTHFSKKTENWIVNEEGGSYIEAIRSIKKVELIHKFLGKKCEREVIVWE